MIQQLIVVDTEFSNFNNVLSYCDISEWVGSISVNLYYARLIHWTIKLDCCMGESNEASRINTTLIYL